MGEFVKREPKKPYEKPKLAVYGTLRELTKKVGSHGSGDGGRLAGRNKTHI
ncbi:MAG: lasso RiPP family leader peptide-containing protein [Candidatus Acidiferrales bacterium]